MGTLVGFDEESAQRIADTVRHVDRMLGNDPSTRRNPAFGLRWHVRGILRETLVRGSFDEPETADMTIYVYDEDDERWSPSGETFEIQDTGMLAADVSLPVGCQVEAGWEGGAWVLSGYDCDLEVVT